MKKIESPYDLYMEFTRDVYNGEVLLISELLTFKRMSAGPELKEYIQSYLNTCRSHMQQLEDLIEDMNESLLEDHCRSMKSMIGDAKKLAERCTTDHLKDFAIITSLQRINRCKINLYETLSNLSEELGLTANRQIFNTCVEDERSFERNLPLQPTIQQT